MKKSLLLAAAAMFLSTTAYAAERVDVFVSIPPVQWLVDNIGREKVNTHILVAAGQDPHTFEPTPRQIATMSKSKIWFTSGLEFEEQLHAKIANISDSLEIIDITDNIDKLPMTAGLHHQDHAPEAQDRHGHDHNHQQAANDHRQQDHQHERHQAHGNGNDDPHVWLSPPNLKIMAEEIAQALTAADREAGDFYTRNAQALHEELDAAHSRIAAMLKPYAGSSFYVYHPSFGYFADTYGLEQRAVEIEGKSPMPKQLKQLIAQAKQEKMRVIFVQPQFDPKSARAVARAIGGNVVPLDPLQGEVIENLMTMAQKISSAMADNT